jgi:hypothetical protein
MRKVVGKKDHKEEKKTERDNSPSTKSLLNQLLEEKLVSPNPILI